MGAEDQIGPRAPGFTGRFELLGQSIPHYDILLIMLAPLVLLLLHMLMKHTRFGLWTRAATDDRDMLAALGVNQSLLFSAVFFLGALLAGLGGALQLPKAGAHAGMDLEILAAAFVVVVCGGMGSISGAYIAALLISLAEVFAIRFLPESALFTMFLVLALILWLRPHGLFGQPEAQASFAPSDLAEKPAFQPLSRQIKIALPGALILLCAMPLLLSASHLPLLTDLLIMSLFAASLFLVVGVSGLMSFGHAAFFGIGAYATALLVTKSTIAMPYAILIAPVAGGLIAGLAGFLFLRLKGVYFAMLTLAFAQVLWSLAQQWIDVTGGGKRDPRPLGPGIYGTQRHLLSRACRRCPRACRTLYSDLLPLRIRRARRARLRPARPRPWPRPAPPAYPHPRYSRRSSRTCRGTPRTRQRQRLSRCAGSCALL